MASKAQLHESIAVREGLKTQAAQVMGGEIDNFNKKAHLFRGLRTTFTGNAENAQPVVEADEPLNAVVQENLEYAIQHFCKSMECELQVEEGNQRANADVVVDGVTIFKDAPATFLLQLEKRLNDVMRVFQAMPTLDPALGFAPDAAAAKRGTFVSRPQVRKRTQKVAEVLVKYQATKEHPAQTEIVTMDKDVGLIETVHLSGMLTPHDKANRIQRLEKLMRAVKKARSTANRVEVKTARATAELKNYLIGADAMRQDDEE